MAGWTGEVVPMAVGCNWTYKLKLAGETPEGSKTELVLGRGVFPSEEEARASGEAHLKSEIEKRSG